MLCMKAGLYTGRDDSASERCGTVDMHLSSTIYRAIRPKIDKGEAIWLHSNGLAVC